MGLLRSNKKSILFSEDALVLLVVTRLERVYVKLSGALQVTGLVLVDDVELSNLIQQGVYLREQSLSGALVGRVAQSLHGVAGRLVEQTVVCALRSGLANALLRRLMVCHNLINVFYFLTFVVCFSCGGFCL